MHGWRSHLDACTAHHHHHHHERLPALAALIRFEGSSTSTHGAGNGGCHGSSMSSLAFESQSHTKSTALPASASGALHLHSSGACIELRIVQGNAWRQISVWMHGRQAPKSEGSRSKMSGILMPKPSKTSLKKRNKTSDVEASKGRILDPQAGCPSIT